MAIARHSCGRFLRLHACAQAFNGTQSFTCLTCIQHCDLFSLHLHIISRYSI